jgi:8-oxo-dGTP pyrophosphatase MutT (NUDIX family)
MKREFSSGIVVYKLLAGKPRYLILHYEEGHWDLPKGHIEKGENAIQAAFRETEEEAGIPKSALEICEKFKEEISYNYRWKKEKETRFKKVTFFLAKLAKRTKVKLSYEHIGYKWLAYSDAKKKLTYENARKMLVSADKFLTKKGL